MSQFRNILHALLVLAVVAVVLNIAVANGQNSGQGSIDAKMKLTTDEAKDGAYKLLKLSQAVNRRKLIIDEWNAKMQADPKYKEAQAEVAAASEEKSKWDDGILKQRGVKPGEFFVNLDTDQVEKIPSAPK